MREDEESDPFPLRRERAAQIQRLLQKEGEMARLKLEGKAIKPSKDVALEADTVRSPSTQPSVLRKEEEIARLNAELELRRTEVAALRNRRRAASSSNAVLVDDTWFKVQLGDTEGAEDRYKATGNAAREPFPDATRVAFFHPDTRVRAPLFHPDTMVQFPTCSEYHISSWMSGPITEPLSKPLPRGPVEYVFREFVPDLPLQGRELHELLKRDDRIIVFAQNNNLVFAQTNTSNLVPASAGEGDYSRGESVQQGRHADYDRDGAHTLADLYQKNGDLSELCELASAEQRGAGRQEGLRNGKASKTQTQTQTQTQTHKQKVIAAMSGGQTQKISMLHNMNEHGVLVEFNAHAIATAQLVFARSKRMMGSEILNILDRRALEVVMDFSPEDVANSLWAMQAFQKLGKKPCEVMLKKLEERMLQCLEMKAEDFGHMMSFVQHPAERVFAGGGTHGHLEQQQEAAFLSMDVNAPDVATTLWSFATMERRPSERLMELLEWRAEWISEDFKAQDTANTLWALAAMGRTPREKMLTLLEKRVVVTGWEFASQDIGNTLWAFASFGKKPGSELLDVLQRRAEGIVKEFIPTTISKSIWAFAQFEEIKLKNVPKRHRTARAFEHEKGSRLVSLLEQRAETIFKEEALGQETNIDTFTPEEVSSMLWGLSKLGRGPHERLVILLERRKAELLQEHIHVQDDIAKAALALKNKITKEAEDLEQHLAAKRHAVKEIRAMANIDAGEREARERLLGDEAKYLKIVLKMKKQEAAEAAAEIEKAKAAKEHAKVQAAKEAKAALDEYTDTHDAEARRQAAQSQAGRSSSIARRASLQELQVAQAAEERLAREVVDLKHGILQHDQARPHIPSQGRASSSILKQGGEKRSSERSLQVRPYGSSATSAADDPASAAEVDTLKQHVLTSAAGAETMNLTDPWRQLHSTAPVTNGESFGTPLLDSKPAAGWRWSWTSPWTLPESHNEEVEVEAKKPLENPFENNNLGKLYEGLKQARAGRQ